MYVFIELIFIYVIMFIYVLVLFTQIFYLIKLNPLPSAHNFWDSIIDCILWEVLY